MTLIVRERPACVELMPLAVLVQPIARKYPELADAASMSAGPV